MTPEQIVTNLELSKRLKELGFPQKTIFYWVISLSKEFSQEPRLYSEIPSFTLLGQFEIIAAPGAEELKAYIPDCIFINEVFYYFKITIERADGVSFCRAIIEDSEGYYYEPGFKGEFVDDTLANALAKMLIWLVENGHVRFDKEPFTS